MDNEIKGEGNSVNYKYRMHDPRIVRFFAPDPLEHEFAFNSTYAFSQNRLIDSRELEGLEAVWSSCGDCRSQEFRDSSSKFQRENPEAALGIASAPLIIMDAFMTGGQITAYVGTILAGSSLLRGINETERGYDALKEGDFEEYNRRLENAGEASKDAIFEGLGGVFGYGLGKIINKVRVSKLKVTDNVTINSSIKGLDVRDAKVVQTISPNAKIDQIIQDAIYNTRMDGVEHAVIQLTDGSRVMVSGGKHGIVLPENTDILFGHTHPPVRSGELNTPSIGDREALDALDQSKQYIFHDGQRTTIYKGKDSSADSSTTNY